MFCWYAREKWEELVQPGGMWGLHWDLLCGTRCRKDLCMMLSQPANIGPQDVPSASSSNVPRSSSKDPIWPSRGRPDLMSRRHPNLTSWGRPEMMSRGHLNLTFKGRPWEVDSGRSQDVLNLKLYWEPSKTFKMEHFLQSYLMIL